MALLTKKKQTCALPCVIIKWTLCVLLMVAAVSALVGVFQTHIIDLSPMRVQFGSTSGSLSIVAFTLASVAWMKQMICCMSTCEACSTK